MKSKRAVTPQISDDAVQAKTGKTWPQWFKILDAAGARKLPHSEIATHLHERYKISGWWSQMVTVAYEQARGMRQKHEKPGGFSIGGSKTIEAPVAKVFAAWQDAKLRRRWLKDRKFTIRKATRNKSMRVTWVDGKTSLDVYFYSKGKGKCQVTLQHSKLAGARHAHRMKEYWGEQLEKLRDIVSAQP